MTQKVLEGMGGHQGSRSTTDEWLTPPEIIRHLGHFDLDPCSSCSQAHGTTGPLLVGGRRYCKCDDGLAREWKGRVWLNPPYGKETGRWLEKMARHGNGIALIFARTDVGYFHDSVFLRAHALLFVKNRITFLRSDGTKPKWNGGAPSVLVAYGEANAVALDKLALPGFFLRLRLQGLTTGGPTGRTV